MVFKTGAASSSPAVIVDSWARSSWQQAATLGHRTVASNSGNLYLDIHRCAQAERTALQKTVLIHALAGLDSSVASHQWADLRAGTTNTTLLAKLLGGETSMWQDFYVPGKKSTERVDTKSTKHLSTTCTV